MKAGIICPPRNTVIFVRIIGALKIYIISYHRFDHSDAILKMHIIISRAMETYLQLGKYEIEDQIDAAKYFANMPFVDKDNIGHRGWSFGGFMSSLAITKGSDVFTAAIPFAPVTSLEFMTTGSAI